MNRLASSKLTYDPVAVVDIGSNSIRLLIYEAPARSLTPIFNEKVLCGLGRRLATTRRLELAPMERAFAALRRFRRIIEQTGARSVHVIATAAARDAENGAEFIAKAQKMIGADIRVLNGEEEAELAAAGIAAGFLDANGVAGDLGGGSLELVDIADGKVRNAQSVQLGALALIDKSAGSLVKAREFIDRDLQTIPWLNAGTGRPFYPIGGAWRTIARIHMHMTGYPLSVVHAYAMTPDDVTQVSNAFTTRHTSAVEKLIAATGERAETLPFAALVMKRVVDRLQSSEVQLSAFGVREGLIYRMLSERERERDPLIAACEDMAQLRSRSLEHARELCRWTDSLFRKPGPKETDEERRLRHAACLLSDIAWRAHPDYRGEQSMSFVAQSSFVGIDHPGRAFLALTVYHRHEKGLKGDMTPQLKRLAGSRWIKRAQIIGAAVRTAHILSAGMAGVIPHTSIGYDENKLVLQLPSKLAPLDGERLQRRLRGLAHLLNCQPEIRISAKFDAARAIMRAISRRTPEPAPE
ncbi:MAG: Ppx/GppA phosphatase family protein [Hyphomicrobiales bacterium]|nr:Ppx/GppA phosphatase family protein [Hyphomicrobiales bacterium]